MGRGAKASKMFFLPPNPCRRVESQWNSNGQRRPFPKPLEQDRPIQPRQPSRPLFQQQQRHPRRQVKGPLSLQALPQRGLLKRWRPILKTVGSQPRGLGNQESTVGRIHRHRESTRKRNDILLTAFLL